MFEYMDHTVLHPHTYSSAIYTLLFSILHHYNLTNIYTFPSTHQLHQKSLLFTQLSYNSTPAFPPNAYLNTTTRSGDLGTPLYTCFHPSTGRPFPSSRQVNSGSSGSKGRITCTENVLPLLKLIDLR